MNTAIIISLGVSLVFCALIYFFLRKRVDGVDKKVNLLMQLVKEHHNQVQQQSQIIMREKTSSDFDHLITVSDNEEEEEEEEEGGEEDYDSDDSMEISDSEDNDINFSHKTENIALESISLSGAETYTHLKEFPTDTLSFNETESPVIEEKVKMSNDIQLDEISLDEKEKSEDDGEDDLDDEGEDDQGDQDDGQGEKGLLEAEVKENTDVIVEIVELKKTEDVATLKVKDLKLRAKEMGLEGYAKLKKQQLISLIVSHKESIGA